MEAVKLGDGLTPLEQENLPPPVHKMDVVKVEAAEEKKRRRLALKMPMFRRRGMKETAKQDEEEEEVVEAEVEQVPKKKKRFLRKPTMKRPKMPSMKPRFRLRARGFKGFRHKKE